jgi:hypothetical protein
MVNLFSFPHFFPVQHLMALIHRPLTSLKKDLTIQKKKIQFCDLIKKKHKNQIPTPNRLLYGLSMRVVPFKTIRSNIKYRKHFYK